MKRETDGNLAKLIAMADIGKPVSEPVLCKFMQIRREAARKTLSHLLAAGYVSADRTGHWTTSAGKTLPMLEYSLTEKGQEAIDRGEPVSISRVQSGRASAAEVEAPPALWEWRDLHQALGMGHPIVLSKGTRLVDHGMELSRK